MARAQFNRDEVVENSVKLFWKHGYNGASMQQVVETTGLKPGSIYLAFGNKDGLYKEALKCYSDSSIRETQRIVESAPDILSGICTVLDSIILASSQKDYCSCFVIKTQLELAAEGGEIYDFAQQRLGEVENVFRDYLKQYFDEQQSRARATSLMLHIFGLRVYGYQNVSAERMRSGLREGLSWLPW